MKCEFCNNTVHSWLDGTIRCEHCKKVLYDDDVIKLMKDGIKANNVKNTRWKFLEME